MIYSRKSSVLSNDINGIFSKTFGNVGGIFNLTFNQLIKSLFSNSEQGFFYDPNDLSTMYQDAAGTVPVTAVGQPVGMVLDKSKGMVLGGELASVTSVTSAQIGGQSVTTYPIANVQMGRAYQITFKVTNYQGSGDVGLAGPVTNWLDNGTVFSNGNGTVRCTRTFIGSGGIIHLYTRSTNQCIFTDISVKELPGNHAFQTTSAARPILRQNATTGAYYLAFDGTDDFLVTNNIDFTGTDKVSLFAGVRKLSDAASGILVELSASSAVNNGSFHLAAPDALNGNNYNFASRGTVRSLAISPSNYISPVSNVESAFCRVSTDTAILRVNGSQVASSAIDQGTGNYGNYPLYIGRRGGTSLPFNGHIYSLIGIGRLTTDSETVSIEKELAKRTGVTLNV